MNRSKSQVTSRFVLPSGVATSGEELKQLHRKLLKNHYDAASPEAKYLKSKKDFVNELYLSRKTEDFQKEIGVNEYDAQQRLSQKQLKAALSNDLIEQMKIKASQQQREKHNVKSQEYQLTKHIDGLEALEREKHRQFKDKYRMQAEEDLKFRQNKKAMENMLSANEKEFYKNRYNQGNLGEGTQITRNASYTNPTKQYYYELDQALKERESKASNPEALQKNSSFKVTRRADSLGTLDFMHEGSQYRSNYYNQSNYYQNIKQRQAQEKQQLKNALLTQIRQREAAKKAEKSQEFNHPYTRQDYLGIHHPIYNPVDFRHAHDNKYVLKELTSLK